MSVDPTRVAPVGPAAGASPAGAARRPDAAPGFDAVLGAKLRQAAAPAGDLRWSAHAVQRLQQRQIAVSPEMQQRLEGAVERLAAKGGRESVVVLDRMAFVVSVANRTVITAVDPAAMRDQVFTNIDSAVLG